MTCVSDTKSGDSSSLPIPQLLNPSLAMLTTIANLSAYGCVTRTFSPMVSRCLPSWLESYHWSINTYLLCLDWTYRFPRLLVLVIYSRLFVFLHLSFCLSLAVSTCIIGCPIVHVVTLLVHFGHITTSHISCTSVTVICCHYLHCMFYIRMPKCQFDLGILG